MGDRIEFEAFLNWGPATKYTVLFSDVDGRHMDLDIASGQRYHVILEPVEPELKPCPFCHCSETTMATRSSGFVVECRRCWASGPSRMTEESAIEAWNQGADNA